MKTIFSVFILLFLQSSLFSQAYSPTVEKGRIWRTLYAIPGTGDIKDYYIRVECDTLINMMQYNMVYKCDSDGNATRKLGSIREDTTTRRDYFVDTGTNVEYLIADYH